MRISDWSSDVCSSDLIAADRRLADPTQYPGLFIGLFLGRAPSGPAFLGPALRNDPTPRLAGRNQQIFEVVRHVAAEWQRAILHAFSQTGRTEERRVGKGWVRKCRSRWSP